MHVSKCMFVYVCMHVCLYKYICMFMYACMCVSICMFHDCGLPKRAEEAVRSLISVVTGSCEKPDIDDWNRQNIGPWQYSSILGRPVSG